MHIDDYFRIVREAINYLEISQRGTAYFSHKVAKITKIFFIFSLFVCFVALCEILFISSLCVR